MASYNGYMQLKDTVTGKICNGQLKIVSSNNGYTVEKGKIS